MWKAQDFLSLNFDDIPILYLQARLILYHWFTQITHKKTIIHVKNCSEITFTKWNFTQVLIILHKCCLWQISRLVHTNMMFLFRPGNVSNSEVPSHSEILQMAAEIADGMAYLESRKIIHRLNLCSWKCYFVIAGNLLWKNFCSPKFSHNIDLQRLGNSELHGVSGQCG